MNAKQAQIIEMAKSGLLEVPKSSGELAAMLARVFDLEKPAKKEFSKKTDDLKRCVNVYMISIARYQSGDRWVYCSKILDQLRRRAYAQNLNEKMKQDGFSLIDAITSNLKKDGLAEFSGNQVKLTSSGLSLVEKIKSAEAKQL